MIERNFATFDYKSLCYSVPNFKSNDLPVQENFKTDFQDGGQGGHLGILI